MIIRVFATETRDEGSSQRIDVQGLIAVTPGLALVVLALVESEAGAPRAAPFAGGLALSTRSG